MATGPARAGTPIISTTVKGLTSTFDMIRNRAFSFSRANDRISAAVPASSPPNWLHGNAKISSPWLWYLSYKWLRCWRGESGQVSFFGAFSSDHQAARQGKAGQGSMAAWQHGSMAGSLNKE